MGERLHMTQQELGAVFRAALKHSVRDQLLVHCLYRFGMRASEAAELPTGAVDLVRWEITITGLKNGSTRTYDIPKDMRPLFRQWKPGSQYFFAYQAPTMSRIAVYNAVKTIMREAGCERFRPHSLRHSMAVHMLDAGLATEDVQDRLRHRRLATTNESYAHLSSKRRNRYQDVLANSKEIVKR